MVDINDIGVLGAEGKDSSQIKAHGENYSTVKVNVRLVLESAVRPNGKWD